MLLPTYCMRQWAALKGWLDPAKNNKRQQVKYFVYKAM